MKRIVLMLVVCLLMVTVFGAVGCSSDTSEGSGTDAGTAPDATYEDSEHDAGEVALCDLSDDLIGWKVTTNGTITFVDLSPPDGTYFEFENAGCKAGAFVHNEFLSAFTEDQKSHIAMGNSVSVVGILAKEQTRMIVSVQSLSATP